MRHGGAGSLKSDSKERPTHRTRYTGPMTRYTLHRSDDSSYYLQTVISHTERVTEERAGWFHAAAPFLAGRCLLLVHINQQMVPVVHAVEPMAEHDAWKLIKTSGR